jgi:hypothetical protein
LGNAPSRKNFIESRSESGWVRGGEIAPKLPECHQFPLPGQPGWRMIRGDKGVSMRTILLAAVCLASLGTPAAMAQGFQVELSAKDPKFKSPACVSMREKVKTYKNGLFDQSPGTYIVAGVAPGGTLGFLALQNRKDDMFRRDIEQACLSNPPDRSYLDKPVGR